MFCFEVLGACAFLALLLTLALVREIRLRRAMQCLLARIFWQRRNRNAAVSNPDPMDAPDHGPGDRGL